MNWVILAEIWDSERIDVVVETRPRDDHLAASMSECWTSTIGAVRWLFREIADSGHPSQQWLQNLGHVEWLGRPTD